MRLAKPWLVAIERYHDRTLQRLMREATLTARHQRIVHLRVKDGLVHLAPLVNVHQPILAHVLMLFRLRKNATQKAILLKLSSRLFENFHQCPYHCARFLLGQQLLDALLKLAPEVKPILLQPGRTLQPLLHQIGQRRFRLGGTDPLDRARIAGKHLRVLLVVLDAVFRLYAELVLQQPELQALEAGRRRQVVAKVHKVERCHRFEDRDLIHQQLD